MREPGRKRQDMKRILPLLTIALACIATTSYAALTYEVAKTPYTNQNYQGTDWEYYTIKVTGGSGKLYIVDVLDNIDTSNVENPQSVSLKGKGITEYGYYKITRDENGIITNVSDLVSKPLEGNAVAFNTFESPAPWSSTMITRYGYELGDFEAGDEVEIYLSTGNAYSSSNNTTHSGNNGNISRYGHWADATQNYKYNWDWTKASAAMPVAELTLYEGWNSNQVPFLIRSDSEMDRFGTPLPGGVPIVLVSGLFALGFWFVRRRKAIAI